MHNNTPLVSVALITYNQKKFIVQCLEGIVMQKTSFPFEVVIGEDCSTDTTRSICIEYQKKYPDLIRFNFPKKNEGMMRNWIYTIQNCKGKYVAMCEGDDYWIDPLKLEKQVSFMEKNPEFSMCSHAADVLNHGHLVKATEIEDKELTITDIIKQDWGIMSASILFRKDALDFPDWFFRMKNGDYALQLLVSLKGKVKILPNVMSVYRKHEAGVSSTLQPFSQATWIIFLLDEFNKYTRYKYKKNVREKIKRIYKNQIQFAKDYNLRKALVKLKIFQALSIFFPFIIKNFRK